MNGAFEIATSPQFFVNLNIRSNFEEMKCRFVLLFMFLFMNAQLMAQGNAAGKDRPVRTLVAYFSATGTTEAAARNIARLTKGELCGIEPVKPYTAADLDWRDKESRSSIEMNDGAARPEMKAVAVDPTAFDVIFIGYPIWWDLAPRIVNTFLESCDLSGKTVIPFATSGSSGIANSAAVLKRTYPALKWQEGRLLNGADEAALCRWLGRNGYVFE